MHLNGRIYGEPRTDAKLFRVTYQRATRLTTPEPEATLHFVTPHWGVAAHMAVQMLPDTLTRICFEEIKLPEETICAEFIEVE